MLNPHSAVSRIKNQLAYKLGSCIIEHNANGGGYLSLIYKLYKIKKEYFKEKKLYKQTIKIFPNLIYPDIKTLNDYNDSIRIKFHLSYMLGETLIQADKNKFKGGYLTLFKDIKQTHKDYNKTKTLLSDFNIISPVMYNAIADNKKIFIKNFNKIENILKTHKDYQAIIDNIFHNFDYVLKHLDLIREWLLSDDFHQRYKKENHPYPSLLDPKKLNDENEEINYNNIPAELAWEMNLPLPENYEFVLISGHCNGASSILLFMNKCKVNIYWIGWLYGFNRYKCYYINLLSSKKSYNALHAGDTSPSMYFAEKKVYNLIQKDIPKLIFYRDPISSLKTSITMQTQIITENRIFKKVDNIAGLLPTIQYTFNKDNLENYNYNTLNSCVLPQETILKYFKAKNKLHYIDSKELDYEHAYNTILNLSKLLKFNNPLINDKDSFIHKISATGIMKDIFPLTIMIPINNKVIKIEFNFQSRVLQKRNDSYVIFGKNIYMYNL
ncbi:DUF2972 domain-containing protein, partial [Campylobacter volucris]|uniref:DUF2972 domain-containing protein n=1 Tax=Campylobacter volucris TaxID=1031542 RepID=UPI00189DDDE5